MSAISGRVRGKVLARFSDGAKGFNARLAAVAGTYGITAFSIDFTSGSKSFFQAQVDPVMVEESTALGDRWMALYSVKIDDTNEQKGQTFSGPVTIGLDVHIYWKSSRIVFDMESVADAVQDAVVALMKDQTTQNWGYETVFTGRTTEVRYPLARATKDSWRQTSRYLFEFEVHER
jgi:hypothetical protein